MRAPYLNDGDVRVYAGDCVEVMAEMDAESVDAVVCDPPYELGFMGREWDRSGVAYRVETWREALRVLKPGGHILAFGGTRTYHRLTCAIEDAGFEIRDSIGYGHMRHVYCQCSPTRPLPYEHDNGSPEDAELHEDMRGVRPDLDSRDPLSGSARKDLLQGVHARSTATAASEEGNPVDPVRGLRGAGSPPAESTAPHDHDDVLVRVQRGPARPGVGEARPQGGGGGDAGGTRACRAEDDRTTEPGLEGRGDVLQEERELHRGQVCEGAGMGASDGESRRIHHGAPPSDGDGLRLSADADGSGASQGPRPVEQRAGEPGAVAVEWIAQGGGAWPACPRCHLPLAPPFDAGPLVWEYGSGFPKSLDVSKAIDKAAGAEREVVGKYVHPGLGPDWSSYPSCDKDYEPGATFGRSGNRDVTAPATPDAARWQGWGTALKPAWEPVVVARKPLVGTVAGNVLAHGVGALNIDGCRIPGTKPATTRGAGGQHGRYSPRAGQGRVEDDGRGRWPANVALDSEAAALLDAQAGPSVSRIGKPRASASPGDGWGMTATGAEYDDHGGPSRFFYTAKPSRADRGDGNTHPTVKPTDLMRWLVRLVTTPGGLVLDPFAGSGTTGVAARAEGFRAVLIEREDEYLQIISRRLSQLSLLGELA